MTSKYSYLTYWSNVLHIVNQTSISSTCAFAVPVALDTRSLIIHVSQAVRAFTCNQNRRESTERANRESTSRRFCSRVGGYVHPTIRNFSPAFPWPGKSFSFYLFFSSYLVPFFCDATFIDTLGRKTWLHHIYRTVLISLKPRWRPPTSTTVANPGPSNLPLIHMVSCTLLPFPHFVRNFLMAEWDSKKGTVQVAWTMLRDRTLGLLIITTVIIGLFGI